MREANAYIDAVKNGNIDALVIESKKELKVYTEKTADRTYRILIEKMHEGAVTLNRVGIILYCNSCFANMVKVPLQKVIGTNLSNFIEESSKEGFETLFRQGWQKAIKEELFLHRYDSKALPVLMSLNMLTLEDDAVLSIILTDLTIPNENREKLELKTKQIQEKNIEIESTNKELFIQIDEKEKRTAELNLANIDVKELGDLNTHKESVIATLSHDLRSPLAGIIGTSAYLKENFEKLKQDDAKEMLDLLHKSATDELRMLDYLVEWARIKYASEAFIPTQIRLWEYVKKVFDTLKENAAKNNLQLHNKVEENISAFVDNKMLLSILQNIVSNSIKHTRSRGTITVTANKKDDKIVVEIEDTGIGMSKEIKEKLFTPQLIHLPTFFCIFASN